MSWSSLPMTIPASDTGAATCMSTSSFGGKTRAWWFPTGSSSITSMSTSATIGSRICVLRVARTTGLTTARASRSYRRCASSAVGARSISSCFGACTPFESSARRPGSSFAASHIKYDFNKLRCELLPGRASIRVRLPRPELRRSSRRDLTRNKLVRLQPPLQGVRAREHRGVA